MAKKAKKAKFGSGKRFAALERKLGRRGDIGDPDALAASIGRKKWGKKRMSKVAAAGRRRKKS